MSSAEQPIQAKARTQAPSCDACGKNRKESGKVRPYRNHMGGTIHLCSLCRVWLTENDYFRRGKMLRPSGYETTGPFPASTHFQKFLRDNGFLVELHINVPRYGADWNTSEKGVATYFLLSSIRGEIRSRQTWLRERNKRVIRELEIEAAELAKGIVRLPLKL